MENRVTIKEYIKIHQDQLSAMGVLAALAALAGGLSVSWIGYLLSFLMLSCLTLIWSEIEMSPNDKSSIKLGFFKFFLKCSFWLIVFYLLLSHRAISWFFLFVPIFLFFMISSVNLIRKSKKIVNFFEKHKTGWVAVVLILMFMSFFASSYLSLPANLLLDAIAKFNAI